MSKLKLFVALTIVGFLGLQSIAVAQTRDIRKDQIKMIRINN
jgi:hypothetical protein